MNMLEQLFANQSDPIIIDDFISPKAISQFLTALNACPDWGLPEIAANQEHLFIESGKPRHLFLSQYMVLSQGKNEQHYLEQCRYYHQIWQELTHTCGFDPFLELCGYLKKAYGIVIEHMTKSSLRYCPCVVRDLAIEVLPHADFGPYDGEGWEVAKVTQQIAWNLYLTSPSEGGDTLIFDQVWENHVQADNNSYGIQDFDRPVKHRFSIKPGRLVLFNSRNFHKVLKSSEARIAIGGFLGKTADGKTLAWS